MNKDYSSIARYYDQITSSYLAPARNAITNYCLEHGIHKVLDIGCGTGVQLASLSQHGIECAGIDSSQDMLALARKRLPEFTDEQLVLGTANSLPFTDKSFDLVICSLLLHESASSTVAILDESRRVASRICFLEWSLPERNLDYLVHWFKHIIERLAGKRHYSAFKAFMRQGGLEGMVYNYNQLMGAGIEGALKPLQRERFRMGSLFLMQAEWH